MKGPKKGLMGDLWETYGGTNFRVLARIFVAGMLPFSMFWHCFFVAGMLPFLMF